MSNEVRITVPMIPVSANHYKVPVWSQRRFYVTQEALAYMDAVAVLGRGQRCSGKQMQAILRVYLGKGDRLDAGNAEKVPMDSLQRAGIIKNDSAIKRLVVEMERDWANPRTEIEITELGAR